RGAGDLVVAHFVAVVPDLESDLAAVGAVVRNHHAGWAAPHLDGRRTDAAHGVPGDLGARGPTGHHDAVVVADDLVARDHQLPRVRRLHAVVAVLAHDGVLQPEVPVGDVARARGPGVLGDRRPVEADAVARVADRGDLPQGDRLGATVGDEPVRAVALRGRALHDDLGRSAVQQDARELAAAERRRRDGEPVDVGGEEAVVAVAD